MNTHMHLTSRSFNAKSAAWHLLVATYSPAHLFNSTVVLPVAERMGFIKHTVVLYHTEKKKKDFNIDLQAKETDERMARVCVQ